MVDNWVANLTQQLLGEAATANACHSRSVQHHPHLIVIAGIRRRPTSPACVLWVCRTTWRGLLPLWRRVRQLRLRRARSRPLGSCLGWWGLGVGAWSSQRACASSRLVNSPGVALGCEWCALVGFACVVRAPDPCGWVRIGEVLEGGRRPCPFCMRLRTVSRRRVPRGEHARN
jgi:hypothetical protein